MNISSTNSPTPGHRGSRNPTGTEICRLFRTGGPGAGLPEGFKERWEKAAGISRDHPSNGSLEGHIGFIEAWIAEGRKDIEGHYAKQFKRNPEDPTYGFVRAYLRARDLRNQEVERPMMLG